MKRIILPFVLLAAISLIAAEGVVSAPSAETAGPSVQASRAAELQASLAADPPIVETFKIADAAIGDNRYPGVCENANGDRLVIFAGPDYTYWYSYCPNDGSWSTPASIPGQPTLDDFTCVDIETDSSGRFHCVWEEPQAAAVYATCLNGIWTTPYELPLAGSYDMSSMLAVRSNDELVLVNGQVLVTPWLTKDIIMYLKGKDATQFQSPVNLTKDHESSAMPHVAVGPNDHIWVVDKSDLNQVDDILVIFLTEWDENNNLVDDWIQVSQDTGWSFWPQVAVNSEGKVMTVWAHSQSNDYWSRIFDPSTKTLSSLIGLKTGLSTTPWATFYSKLAAHGKDFYAAAMTSARILYLLKFDELTSAWTRVAQISTGPVDYFDLYSGFNTMLVAWGDFSQPANVYLTTVSADPLGSSKPVLTIQSSVGGTTDPVPGSYRYDKGASVTIKAIPSADYYFTSWSGDVTGTSDSITVTMDGNLTVRAIFTPKPALTIQAGAGGTTSPVPGTYRYDKGASVTVQAVPDADYQFNSWSGDVIGTSESITVTMDKNFTVKANFTLKPALTIQAGPGGTTNPVPGTYRYLTGSQVIVRALPNAAFRFGSWSGDAAGAANPVTVAMTGDKTIRANFILFPAPPLDLTLETVLDESSIQKINRLAWHRNPKNAGVQLEAYGIYRKAADRPDGDFVKIATALPYAFSFEDGGLPLDRKYTYCMTTIPKDPAGEEGGRSESVTEKSVFPPLDVSCRSVLNNSLFQREKINILSWRDSPLNWDVDIAQFDIYRKPADQEDFAYSLIASVAVGVLEFRDRMLPVGGRYVYVIRSVDSGGAVSGTSNPGRD